MKSTNIENFLVSSSFNYTLTLFCFFFICSQKFPFILIVFSWLVGIVGQVLTQKVHLSNGTDVLFGRSSFLKTTLDKVLSKGPCFLIIALSSNSATNSLEACTLHSRLLKSLQSCIRKDGSTHKNLAALTEQKGLVPSSQMGAVHRYGNSFTPVWVLPVS